MAEVGSKSRDKIVRRVFLRTVLLFLGLFAANGGVLGYLLIHDFDQRAVWEKLAETADVGAEIAALLNDEVAPGGSVDFVRLVQRREYIGEVISKYTARLRLVNRVQVVDSAGRSLTFPVDQQSSVRDIPIGGAFSGDAPPSPDSPPPALPLGTSFALVGAERVINVPLGTGSGKLLLALTPGPTHEEVQRLRNTLMLRLLLGGAISVALLAVAFLYVLRLLHRTQRLEAESQRAEHLAYLGTLASGLAHEIRNPLNAMNINLQLLEEELDENKLADDSVSLLRSSRQEVSRLERLVKDFLLFAKPQPARREELAPAELVADVVRFMRPVFHEASVKLDFVQEPGAPAVRIDTGQVRQALLNVLQNALEASPRPGTVTVRVGATERGEARIDVLDEGPGVPAEVRAEIFQAFWSKKPAGSGLGLPIAQRAIEAHGGRIEVDSTPGQGSLFRIVLPSAIVVVPDQAVASGGSTASETR